MAVTAKIRITADTPDELLIATLGIPPNNRENAFDFELKDAAELMSDILTLMFDDSIANMSYFDCPEIPCPLRKIPVWLRQVPDGSVVIIEIPKESYSAESIAKVKAEIESLGKSIQAIVVSSDWQVFAYRNHDVDTKNKQGA